MNVYNTPEENEVIKTLLDKIKELEATLENLKLKNTIDENHKFEPLKEDLKVKKKRIKKEGWERSFWWSRVQSRYERCGG